jgi:hypothetical protein
LSFWGGAHATRPARTRVAAANTDGTREIFLAIIAEPSDGQNAAQWRSGNGAASPR